MATLPDSTPKPTLTPVAAPLLRFAALSGTIFERLVAAQTGAGDAPFREALRMFRNDPAIREAVHVASPDLCDTLDRHSDDEAISQGPALALFKYLLRGSSRATPFGLFAGVGLGRYADEATLEVGADEGRRRWVTADHGLLERIVDRLIADPVVRWAIRWEVNNSLHPLGRRVRGTEVVAGEKGQRGYLQVEFEMSDSLALVLEAVKAPETLDLICGRLIALGHSAEAAREYVEMLVTAQVLLPTLTPPMTGPQGLSWVLQELTRACPGHAALADLRLFEDRCALLESSSAPEALKIHAELRALPLLGEDPLPRDLVQVDLWHGHTPCGVPPEVVQMTAEAVQELLRWGMGGGTAPDLQRWAQTLQDRFGDRSVPLMQALDPDLGVGLPWANEDALDDAPLAELRPPAPAPGTAPPATRADLLRRAAAEELTYRRRSFDIRDLTPEPSGSAPPPPLTPTLTAMITLLPAGETGAEGAGGILFKSAVGGSGLQLLGRFTGGSAPLREAVRAIVQAEESRDPGVVFAEVVHLPVGRLGNVIHRPVLRAHEIPFLGRSGAPPDAQIPVSDLLVSAQGGTIHLWSGRTGARILPRLSSAHNFSAPANHGVYRFLAALQGQGTIAGIRWEWGEHASREHLPRVTAGLVVLAPEQWTLRGEALRRLADLKGRALTDAVRELGARHDWPELVLLVEGDNEIPVAWRTDAGARLFQDLVGGHPAVRISESLGDPRSSPVRGPTGPHAHEFLIPLQSDAPRPAAPARAPAGRPRVVHLPGGEWHYLKVHGSFATIDRALAMVVQPLMQEQMAGGLRDWFFLRYTEGGSPHLRLRWREREAGAGRRCEAALVEALTPLVKEEAIRRLEIDTYEPEIERYGGPQGIGLAERLFHVDSEIVAAQLAALRGSEGERDRWQLAIFNLRALFRGCGFEGKELLTLVEEIHEQSAKGAGRTGREISKALSQYQRERRARLDALCGGTLPEEDPLAPGVAAAAPWSSALEEATARLREADASGNLTVPLREMLASFAHMSMNRLFPRPERQQELIVYNLLLKGLMSERGRAKAGAAVAR